MCFAEIRVLQPRPSRPQGRNQNLRKDHPGIAPIAFNGNASVLPVFPMPGGLGNIATVVAIGKTGDQTEGATLSVEVYG